MTGHRDPIACRPRHRLRSSRRSSRSGGWNVGGLTGSAPSLASPHAPCRGCWPATLCRGWRCWTRSPGEVIRASKVTAVRYERDRPGELVHMDVKKLGRIPDGGGWRIHGRGIPRDRVNGPGFDYVHSVVDDHSRMAYSEVLADEKGPT